VQPWGAARVVNHSPEEANIRKPPMFTDDPPQVEEIERKIQAIFYPSDATLPPYYEFGHIMSALMNCIIFQMAMVCPICRKNIARKIKRDLPTMVAYASRLGNPPTKCSTH
jgi:hypothetical protein